MAVGFHLSRGGVAVQRRSRRPKPRNIVAQQRGAARPEAFLGGRDGADPVGAEHAEILPETAPGDHHEGPFRPDDAKRPGPAAGRGAFPVGTVDLDDAFLPVCRRDLRQVMEAA
jgi:hypothetical protein